MKDFLRFEQLETTGKTKKFNVYSTHSDDFLGIIRWQNGWRHYVMDFDRECIWSLACIKQLHDFLEKLEEEREE